MFHTAVFTHFQCFFVFVFVLEIIRDLGRMYFSGRDVYVCVCMCIYSSEYTHMHIRYDSLCTEEYKQEKYKKN